MRVFVLNNQKQPLMPCRPARARRLLRSGKAAVFRRYPFTIILKERNDGATQPISLNIDPGSRTTGVALVALFQRGAVAIAALHLEHRSFVIKSNLDSRRAIRRSRRHRKTRYRQPRFLNRTRPAGWLPPSVNSRVENVATWANRLKRLAPISQANVETVRFDTQKLENSAISGIEYQQGTLFGFEVREYLLRRHQHICAYCQGLSKDPILEVEHVMPRTLGGSNRVANLVIACWTCNNDKGSLHPANWQSVCAGKKDALNQRRAQQMGKVLAGYRPTLKDAAAVNATRYAVGRAIKNLLANTQFWSGGRTKKNRSAQNYPKDHWIDAACVGPQGGQVFLECQSLLVVTAQGHGSRQMCRMDRYGFPRTNAKQQRTVKGFSTGDIVKAVVTRGKKQGTYSGRVAVRASGSFNIKTAEGTIQGISHRFCKKRHAADGYGYHQQKIATTLKKEKSGNRLPSGSALSLPALKDWVSRAK